MNRPLYVCGRRALIRQVVIVVERRHLVLIGSSVTLVNHRKAVQIIIVFGRRHHSLAIVLKPNIAHQQRIGKVTVNGGIRPIATAQSHIARNKTAVILSRDIAEMVATITESELRMESERASNHALG